MHSVMNDKYITTRNNNNINEKKSSRRAKSGAMGISKAET